VLDVDLVDDARARGHDLEVVERRLAPAQELVALLVALVLDLDVALEGVGAAEDVDDDRVVDDHLGRRQRVDPGRVATEVGDGLAHGREVDDAGHAGEVLHDDARRRELDLGVGLGVLVPGADRADVVGRDVGAVLRAQEVLEEHLEAVGQVLLPLDLCEAVDLVGLTSDLEGPLGLEAVNTAHDGLLPATLLDARAQYILTSRYI
jgi:hypothetical protein